MMSEEMTCCVHTESEALSKVTCCSQVSWAKIRLCAEKWKVLNVPERKIATDLLLLPTDELSKLPVDNSIGYHRKCYSKFTDKNRITAAEKRNLQTSDEVIKGLDQPESSNSQNSRILRSDCGFLLQANKNSSVLPAVCLICKTEKYNVDRHTGKRKKERLAQCETKENLLLQAATAKNDEMMLLQIRGKDLVAIEMRYHRSCYKRYIKFLTVDKSAQPVDTMYKKSFDIFCKDIVEEKIIKQNSIMRLNKLVELFVNIVSEIENVDITGYRNFLLKRRIQKLYPQIDFIKRSRSNQCELVLCDTMSRNIYREISTVSTTETEDSDAEVEKTISNPRPYVSGLRDLFFSAKSLNQVLMNIPSFTSCWPPKESDLTTEAASEMVPPELFNFIAWCVGASDEVLEKECVSVNEDIRRKILSISQDLIYLSSSGKRQTPKHLALGMTIRHLTGSASLIYLLNGLGHCVSHTTVLQHDTALALQQLNKNNLLPHGFTKKTFTTVVWDNNDFGEETLSGCGTTHNTNGIILQWESESSSLTETLQESETNFSPMKKGRKRTLNVNIPPMEIFTGRKKHCPPRYDSLPIVNSDKYMSVQNVPRMTDNFFYLSKFFCVEGQNLPGWTGFNTLLKNAENREFPKTKIGYLPILDANPTDMSTVNCILKRSIQIANDLDIDSIVLVMDQAIYSKAQQIRWQNDQFQKRLVIRLGEFHTAMAFLAVIGKRFCDAGLRDIFIESGLVADGSIQGVISGHHYNRSVRANKLMCEALHRLCFQSFLHELEQKEQVAIKELIAEFQSTFESESSETYIFEDNVSQVLKKYSDFVVKNSIDNPTFSFWSSYFEMIEILLIFIRATREGNWELHLSAIHSMLPWFFAYDRVNYSRYLSIYWCEMQRLGETHPDIKEEFMAGNFSVQQQGKYGFSKTPCDQVIEQTCNRDSKTKGGLTGITRNKGAVNRWILSHHSRAIISHYCKVMAGKVEYVRNRKELDPSRIKQDEEDVLKIMETIQTMFNPFELNCTELINIVTGGVTPLDVQQDIITAHKVGEACFETFLSKRLGDHQMALDFFSPLKILKLKTFSNIGKTTNMKVKDKMLALKSSKDLLNRLLVIAKVKDMNLCDIMKFSLNPIPLSLGSHDGVISKTNKASLFHYIEKNYVCGIASMEEIPSDKESVLLIDGMALIHQMNNTPLTFGDFANNILNSVLKLAEKFKCKRVDFITDRYPKLSIKGMERERRASIGTQVMKISHSNQKMPKQFKQFLGCGQNKEALVEFFFQVWKNSSPTLFRDVILFITHGDKCHSIESIDGKNLTVLELAALESDHEEADTRLLLHAAQASLIYKSILILSPDTDVFMLSLAFAEHLRAPIYFVQMAKGIKVLDAQAINRKLSPDICKALLGLHVYTGCDSVSCFKGKSKTKAFKIMIESRLFISAFQDLGKLWTMNNSVMENLEMFTCELYGRKNSKNIDECRHDWLRLGCKSDTMLPPNKDSLLKHMLRANYQTSIYRKSLMAKIAMPSPIHHGWKISDDRLEIEWMANEPVPKTLIQHVHCKCKKTACETFMCSCRAANLHCTELCCCHSCNNCATSETDTED